MTEEVTENHYRRSPIMVVVDWLLYVPFIVGFALTLVVFEPLQRLAILISQKSHDRTIFGLNFCLTYVLRLQGTRIRTTGNTNIPASRPYIIISNHQSMFDIPLIYRSLWKLHPRFIAKKELAYGIPSISFNVRHGHNLWIDRADPRQSIKAIQNYAKFITENKYCAVIFPEGTRGRKGLLKDFHAAGPTALLKHAPTAAIIPICVNGSWKLNKHKPSPTWAFSRVTINVGDVIERTEDKSTSDILDQAYAFVSQHLES